MLVLGESLVMVVVRAKFTLPMLTVTAVAGKIGGGCVYVASILNCLQLALGNRCRRREVLAEEISPYNSGGET